MVKRRSLSDVNPDTIPITIDIPYALWEKLQPIVQRRGIDIDGMLHVHLQTLVNAADRSRALMLHDEMPFGKLKGIPLEDAIRTEPRYIAWLLSESSNFYLDQDCEQLLDEIMQAEKGHL